MSVMERRLQLLLDRERFRLVEQEATRSRRSVAAVIREAIDWRFDNGRPERARAAARLLRNTAHSQGPEPDWGTVEDAMDAELVDRLP